MKRILHTFFLVLLLLNSALHAFEKNSAQNKKVFLTGAAGFIGSNCLKYLFDKYPDYEFVVLDALTYAGNLENIPAYIKESDRYQFIHGSVTDFAVVDEIMKSANFVVHFAAFFMIFGFSFHFESLNLEIGSKFFSSQLIKFASEVD